MLWSQSEDWNERSVIISEARMAGAWGAGSGSQLGASLTSSQYFPPLAPADEEGNLWADLLKGDFTYWTLYLCYVGLSKDFKFKPEYLILRSWPSTTEVAANKHSVLPSRNLLVLGDRDRWLDFFVVYDAFPTGCLLDGQVQLLVIHVDVVMLCVLYIIENICQHVE